jgi:thiol:disulfide interchange protein DsbD
MVLLAAANLCVPRGQAANSPIPHGTVELLAEHPWIAAGHTVNLGLHFQLQKGWHIYWINPGDSGEPPRVRWQLPDGLSAGATEWPAPRRLGNASIVDFGYEDDVTLIVPMHASDQLRNQPSAELAAQISVLVCREMCIPGKAQLALSLPVNPQAPVADARTAELFAAARKRLPRPAPANWKIALAEENSSFELTVRLGRPITQAAFYPLVESQIDNATPQKLVSAPNGFRLTLQKSDRLAQPISRLKGVLVFSAGQAYSIDVPLSKSPAATNGLDFASRPT